ncbi:hypothetical protein [Arthrobacter sp. BF1]|uniref:hypothetical protein n=1 Tax=Arthrobacter sp. BF1 TaxID=2821145 RepID=UPI001C4EB5C9|nr:hypothetical protein [Arthrobacter sp. BF1]
MNVQDRDFGGNPELTFDGGEVLPLRDGMGDPGSGIVDLYEPNGRRDSGQNYGDSH